MKASSFCSFSSVLGIENSAFLVHPRLHSMAEKHPSPIVFTWWEGRHWMTGETGGGQSELSGHRSGPLRSGNNTGVVSCKRQN